MTTPNQPSDAAKAIAREAFAEIFGSHIVLTTSAIGTAALVIDRHLTPSEPVAYLLEWPNAETGAPMRAVTISKPEVIAGESLTPLYATPATVNSYTGLMEALGKAVQWFDQYADEHERKALQTGDDSEVIARLAKARTNKERADFLRAALSAIPTPAVNAELVERVSLELRNIIKRATYQPDEDIGQLRINCDKVVLFAECALKALSRAKGEGA